MAGTGGIKAGRAFVELYLKNNVPRGLKRAQRQIKGFGAGLAGIGGAITAPASLAAGPLAFAIKTYSDFESQMAQVSTMVGDQSGLMDTYRAGVRRMAVETGEGTDTLAAGLYDILSASVPPTQALEVLGVAARSAKAGLTDTGTSADAITTILNAYGLEANRAGDVSDLLFSIVKRGKTTFGQLAKAALARHGEPVMREYKAGQLAIGDRIIECAVLEDKTTRVVSHRGFARVLGASKPMSSTRRGAGELPAFLNAKNLSPFIDSDLATAAKPVRYTPDGGGALTYGLRAEAIPQICNVWLKAREAGVLRHNQMHLAAGAEIIVRGLAEVGIVALVDEATGFQAERKRDDLAEILRAFVAKELRKWVRTFDPEYYAGLCRLWEVPYPPAKNQFPQYFGTLTNNIIYDRLAPGVKRALQQKNPPLDGGRRKHKHHQYLTENKGHPALKEHIAAVIALMKVSKGKDDFMDMLDVAKPKYEPMPLFDGQEDAVD